MKYLDIGGPKGNAFVLLGIAQNWLRDSVDTEEEVTEIINRMKTGDYNNLLYHFNLLFDSFVTLTADRELAGVNEENYIIKESEWI
jgi:hypothetical protein